MFSKLYKFSKFVMYLNSCSMDLGRDRDGSKSQLEPNSTRRQWWLEVEDFLRWVERGRSGQQWCVGWR